MAGVGTEMGFHLFSPMIKEIEVLQRAKPGRCKLYHLRDKPQVLLALNSNPKAKTKTTAAA